MKTGRVRFLGLSVLLLVLNLGGWLWLRTELVAAELDEVRVVSTFPEGSADGAAELAFLFDRALVGSEAVGTPLASPPLSIAPPLPGTWRWSRPDRLTLELDDPLPPGRRWIAEARENFAQLVGKRLAGTRSHAFETSGVAVLGFELDRVVGKYAEVAVLLDQSVDPRALGQHVQVLGDRPAVEGPPVELPFEALGEAPGIRQVLRVEAGDHRALTLRVDAELRGVGAELPLGEDVERSLELPSRLTLLRARGGSTQWTSNSTALPRSSASLVFSRGLDPNQELSSIEVRPEVEDLSIRVRGHELRLEGRFEVGEIYVASVPPSLLSRDGSTLGRSADLGFRVSSPRARVDFETSRGQLSTEGHLELGLEAGGIDGVELRAWRLHASNLVPHLRGDSVRATSRNLGARSYPVNLGEQELRELTVDLEALLGKQASHDLGSEGPRGLFHIEARATDDPWVRDRTVVSIADLALVAKREARGWFVWVVSLSTGAPQADVRVAARSYNDQLLAEGTTDGSGCALLRLPPGNATDGEGRPDGDAFVILAERGEELAWVQAGRQGWYGFDEAGIGRRAPGRLDAMLFADRDILRPGERGDVCGLVRRADGSLPADEALTLVVRRPDGREHGRHPLDVGDLAQGFLHHAFATRADDPTGTYGLSLEDHGGQVLASAQLAVEAFVPARTEMEAQLAATHVLGATPFRIRVDATSLLGGPAPGLRLRAHGELRAAAFASKALPAFTFAAPTQLGIRHLRGVEGLLDEDGHGELELPTDLESTPGLYRGQVVATVIEPSGRSLSRRMEASVDTAEAHWGLCLSNPEGPDRTAASPRVPRDQDILVHWTRRDAEDLPAPPSAPGRLRLLEVRGEWVPKARHAGHGYVFEERVTEVSRMDVESFLTDKGYGRVQVRCPDEGHYRIELQDPTGEGTTTLDLVAGTGSGGSAASHGSASPERVSIDRPSITTGSDGQLRARIHPPFPGSLLLTLESDRVLASQVLEVEAESLDVSFPMPAALRGGAYLTAHLVRGTLAEGGTLATDPKAVNAPFGPRRARGQAKVEFDVTDRDLDLRWTHPERALPGAPASITVHRRHVEGDDPSRGHVMLWAVDRGIHLRTGYRTPDPLAHFHGSRRASIETFDIYGDLIAELERPEGLDRIGGDAASVGLRRGTAGVRHRKPAVRFLGLANFDAEGAARFDFEWPRFQGELQLSAVAADGDDYGSASSTILVRAPLSVQAGWPRTLSPGDRARVPVRISNHGDQACTVGLELEFDAPVEGPAGTFSVRGLEESFAVPAGHTVDHVLEVDALTLGTVLPRLGLSSDQSSVPSGVDFGECTVRSPAALRSERSLHRLAAGESIEIAVPDSLEPEGVATRVRWGTSPRVELGPALSMLLEYPHGCVEQTASRILPLVHVPDGLGAEGEFVAQGDRRHDLVRTGLARFESMQTPDGGLAYWPGGSSSIPWGSALAAEVCLDASRRGYDLDPRFRDALLDYLEGLLATSKLPEDAVSVRARICHVLAGFGRPMRGWTSRLSEDLHALPPAARAHLALAWHGMGDRERSRSMLEGSWAGVRAPRRLEGAPTGPELEAAILLHALIEVQPDHPGIPGLVRELEGARREGTWGTTQATAACLVALARYQEGQPAAVAFRGRRIDGSGVASDFGSDDPSSGVFTDGGPLQVFENHGPGDLFLVVEHSGLTAKPATEAEDRGLRLRRRWLDLDGSPLDPGTLTVGDLIRVELRLSAPDLGPGTRIPHVAITDAFPAGFEVENPRLETSVRGLAVSRDARTEFLDDRVLHFTDALPEERVVEYLLRATTAGSFVLPQSEASCMDAPDLASIDPGVGAPRVPVDGELRIEVRP